MCCWVQCEAHIEICVLTTRPNFTATSPNVSQKSLATRSLPAFRRFPPRRPISASTAIGTPQRVVSISKAVEAGSHSACHTVVTSMCYTLLGFQMDQQRSVDLWLSGQRNSNIRYVLVNLVEFWNSKMLRRQPPGRPVTHGGFIKNFDWGRIACAA